MIALARLLTGVCRGALACEAQRSGYHHSCKSLMAIDLQSTYAQAEGAPGSQGDTTLIFLHGLFGSSKNWAVHQKGIVKWHTEEGHPGHLKTFAVDLRNHGQSQHCKTMTYDEMSDDLACFLESNDINDALVVGHSMGGKVALHLALRDGAKSRIRDILAVDVAPVPYNAVHDHDEKFDGMLAVAQHMRKLRKKTDAHQYMEPFVPDKGTRLYLLDNLVIPDGEKPRWQFNLQSLSDNRQVVLGFPHHENSVDKDIRVTFVTGGNSHYLSPEFQRETARLFPGSKIIRIPGADHWVHYQKPKEFLSILKGLIHPT